MKHLIRNKEGFLGPTFSSKNRIFRFIWSLAWLVLARWTPPYIHKWRIFLINIFGGKVSYKSYIYPSVKIWAPWNLYMEDYATLARGVDCYNIEKVFIGVKAIVSQDARIYTGSHNYNDIAFALIAKPIKIETRAWVAACCFVGPGVCVGEGAILGAAGVTFKDLESWSIYIGNPANKIKDRKRL
jgi:putative colanic acid biosynthesis acetyltransferase WcaF